MTGCCCQYLMVWGGTICQRLPQAFLGCRRHSLLKPKKTTISGGKMQNRQCYAWLNPTWQPTNTIQIVM
jgi:hypothetical protein